MLILSSVDFIVCKIWWVLSEDEIDTDPCTDMYHNHNHNHTGRVSWICTMLANKLVDCIVILEYS